VSATGLPLCDGTFQDCVTKNGDVCVAGTTAHECEIDEPESSFVTCFDGSAAATLTECPPTPEPGIPNPAFAPGFYAEPVPETPEKEDGSGDCGNVGEEHGESGKAFSKDSYEGCPTDPITGKNPY